MKRAASGSPAALEAYQARRNFGTTREPSGEHVGKTAGFSFVVQKHAARRLHYDFRLELDGVLKSWAVTRGPSYNLQDKRLAVRVEDHPLDYATFEGTIPHGQYGGGTVMVWDRGHWQPDGDPAQGLEHGKLAFTLDGEKLRGRWALVRMRDDPKSKRENWLLIKEKDEFANNVPDVLEQAQSVTTGRSLEQIASNQPVPKPATRRAGPRRTLPDFVAPALATLTDRLPRTGGWLFEIKYDGYRAQIAADRDQVRIYSRSGLDWTERFGPIVRAIAQRGFDRVLIDAEIVVLDRHGRSDFGLLQQWLETGQGAPSCFAFDLLAAAGRDLRKIPFTERRARLLATIGENESGPIYYSAGFETDDAGALFVETCNQGLEGLIAKRADAPYRAGRTPTWLKIKCGHQQEFVVIGWSQSQRRAFSSLLLGIHDDAGLRYAGRVGSGFSEALLAKLARSFEALAIPAPSVAVPAAIARTAHFVQPQIVVEVRFAGWTPDNLVRHGTVLGVREDKPASAIVREAAAMPSNNTDAIAGITLTHPDKVLFHEPDVTKAALARYLAEIGPVMTRYAANRFVSLLRAPRGPKLQGFFQRHPQAGLDRYWQSQQLDNDDNHGAYLYFTDPRALIEAAQMDALEFHIWGSRIDRPGQPDRIVFDLDPAPDVEFAAVRQGAYDVREVLRALGLESLPMLSGGKGIHVVAPIAPQADWAKVKQFAADVAARLSAAEPDRYVATMTKSKRTGRIFIDHFRNDRTASAVAPFSPRNRPGGPVAWPLAWHDLDAIKTAAAVSMTEALHLIKKSGDPWGRYDTIKQSLTKKMSVAVSAEV